MYRENTRVSLSLSLPLLSLSSGWHFCLDDFNKLLHTKLNKVRVRCCWGNLQIIIIPYLGQKANLRFTRKGTQATATAPASSPAPTLRLRLGLWSDKTLYKLQTATQSAQQRGWQNGSTSGRETERERRGRENLTGRSTGQTSITA